MTAPKLAARPAAMPVPATFAAAARVRALRAEGRDIISLTLGEPDFDSPAEAVEAAHHAALTGQTKYPPVRGTPALIAAIQNKFLRESGVSYGEEQIIACNGARQVIFDALSAILDPGDEVIIPAPYWNAYPMIAHLLGATSVFVECRLRDGFLPDPGTIARAITPATRLLILNFPNNPTGAVCPADRLTAIADILRVHPDIWVLSDDLYEHLIHDGNAHATMATVAPWLRDRVLTVCGVSKTYAMTGWRVGFGAGPARLIAAMAKIQGQSTGGVSPIAQEAAAAALNADQARVGVMQAVYARRRDTVIAALGNLACLDCHTPQGAFYLYPGIARCLGQRSGAGRFLATDADFAEALLEEEGVGVVHGAAFGLSPYLRLSTAADDASLVAACTRISRFCLALTP